MTPRRLVLTAGVLVSALLGGCHDIPGAPTWDADWYVPMPAQSIAFDAAFGVPAVPAGTTVPISFAPISQALDDAIGQILDQEISNAQVILTLRKSIAVQASDTLFVGDSPTLAGGDPRTILVPLNMAAADTSVTDTIPFSPVQLDMLRQAAAANGQIWLRLSGSATWPGPGTLAVNAGDFLGVRVALIARIAMSR